MTQQQVIQHVGGGRIVGQQGPGTHTVGHLFRPPPEGGAR